MTRCLSVGSDQISCKCTQVEPTVNADLLQQLQDMGFPKNRQAVLVADCCN